MNGRKAKPWAVLAVVSLAVNLFLGGLLVGRVLRPDPPPRDMGPISLFRATRDLDPDSRAVVDRVRGRRGDAIRDKMGLAGEARAAAIEALCAEAFDEAKVREAFRVFREASAGAHDEMHETMIELAREMTPEQRKKLKELLERDRGGHRGRGRGAGDSIRGGPHGGRGPWRGGSSAAAPAESVVP